MPTYYGTPGNDVIDAYALNLSDSTDIDGGRGDDIVTLRYNGFIAGLGQDTVIGTGAYSGYGLWNAQKGCTVNLELGTAIDGFGGFDTLINIHVVHDSFFNDTLTGSKNDDTFWLNGGSNRVNGGNGVDKVIYNTKSKGFSISYPAFGEAIIKRPDGSVDRLTNIERIEFSDRTFTVQTSFQNFTALPTQSLLNKPGALTEVIALDVNGDGWDDLVSGCMPAAGGNEPTPVEILLNAKNGTFVDATDSSFVGPVAQGVLPREIIAADFNGDGIKDILIADTGYDATPFPGYRNTLMLGTNTGQFVDASSRLPDLFDFTHSADVGDIDGDGDLDIYAGNIAGIPSPYLLINDGQANFTMDAASLPDKVSGMDRGSHPTSLFVDVDQDGDLDLYLGGDHRTEQTILLNDGAGHFSEGPALPPGIFGATGTITNEAQAFDFDGDGRMEILTASTRSDPFYDGGVLQILQASADGTFADVTSTYLSALSTQSWWIRYVHFVDLNNDGAKDIVCEVSGNPIAYLNNGANFFYLLPADFLPSADALEMTDVDRDGWMDMVALSGNAGTRFLTVYKLKPQSASQVGTVGADVLLGREFADTLAGGAGDDMLAGALGNDDVRGGSGTDTLLGGDGDDTLEGGAGADILEGGAGFNFVSYASSLIAIQVDLTGALSPLDQVGGSANEAYGDRLSEIQGIIGGAGNDTLIGDAQANWLSSGAGNDTLHGGDDADTLDGGMGVDAVSYASSDAGVTIDLMLEGPQISAGHASGDLLVGIENLFGSSFDDVLVGDGSANSLWGGDGADTLDGGAGLDTASYEAASDAVSVSLLTGTGAHGDASGDLLINIENLTGGFGNDTLEGNAEANILIGGAGADSLIGGDGNDIYYVDNSGDVIVETSEGGVSDTVYASVSYALGDWSERIYALGSSSIGLTGNSLSNVIVGNAGRNTIKGNSGNDMINGAAGNDTLYGGAGRDTFLFNTKISSTNVDKIMDYTVRDDIVHLENAVFTKLKAGKLASAAFWKGSKAHDSSDRIIYDSTKGYLYYDADGTGKSKQVLIATMAKGLKMSNGEFYII